MSAEDTFEVPEEPQATVILFFFDDLQGQRWLVPMDFSIQANAALDWVLAIMKPEDHLLILNVLNLKAPSILQFSYLIVQLMLMILLSTSV